MNLLVTRNVVSYLFRGIIIGANMKSLSFLCSIFLFCSSLSSKEPQFIPTGYQPLAIHAVADTIHVFCNGNDIDFDGVYEPLSGEKPAMWYIYDANTNVPVKAIIMQNGYFDVPFRPGLSSTRLYLPRQNKIEVYDLSTQELLDSSLLQLPDKKSKITGIHVVSTHQSGVSNDVALALSHKTSFTEPGQIEIYSLISRQTLLQKEVGINPQMIRTYKNLLGQMEFAVLCEGTFGGRNSALYVINTASGTGEPNMTILELGDTGNHFIIQDQLALTVMNGSHEIIPVNLATKTVLPSISVGTSGYDGPREIIVDTMANRVYLSTYASDIRIGSFTDGTVIGQWFPKGKPEGMAFIKNSLWVCNAFKSGDYVPDSTIALFTLDESTSIQERAELSLEADISMHEGICIIKSQLEGEDIDYTVMNTKGTVVSKGTFNGKEHRLSFLGLPYGVYVITLNSSKLSSSTLVIFRD